MKKSDREVYYQPLRVKKAINLPPEEVKAVATKKKPVCKVTKGDHVFEWRHDQSCPWIKDWFIQKCICGKKGNWFSSRTLYCIHCKNTSWRWNLDDPIPSCRNRKCRKHFNQPRKLRW